MAITYKPLPCPSTSSSAVLRTCPQRAQRLAGSISSSRPRIGNWRTTRPVQTSAVASLYEGQADVGALNDKAVIENSWAKSSQSGQGHSEDERVITTFRWPAALDGQEVSVSGSFNGWESRIVLRKSPETSDFVRSVALPPDTVQYKYRVNGQWMTSPCEAITSDGTGQFNNQRLVAASATFVWQSKWGGNEVFITGDFVAWTELLPLTRDPSNGDFRLRGSLPAGTYSYQFLVDGSWMTSPEAAVAPDDDGHLCNMITVDSPPAFHVYYATGWEKPVLHFRELRADGQPFSQWQQAQMSKSPSRAQPNGGAWFMAIIPATKSSSESVEQLEFFLTDGSHQEDKPMHGGNYLCSTPGGYKLQQGRLAPFARARAPPMMLVSDLDGTMVADGEAADAATQAFCNYWESNSALVGSVLVYNTGRSLGGFISLFDEKAGALALPDVLITAVGTKIFLLDHQAEGRATASPQSWKEDMQWSRRLDFGWDLDKVKQVAARVVQELEGHGAGHWLDHGTEHPHRIALSVRADKVKHVVGQLNAGFKGQGVQVRVIVSGVGGWRYVDCVSIKGGKLEALEYVRTLFSIPRDRCVAAGDSGNDILMLEGGNQAVVVGNAQPELVDWLVKQPQDSRIVYTDATLARGVLEGITRHGLF